MASTDGREFARRLAKFLESLSEDDVADVASGAASLEIRREERRQKAGDRKRKASVPSEAQLRQVLDDLHAASDREVGFAKLDQDQNLLWS